MNFPMRNDFIRMASFTMCGSDARIVDIGCNIGNAFGEYAINVDRRSYRTIVNDAKTYHGDITIPNFIQADGAHLPFKDGSFDIAVLSEILEHAEHPRDLLEEAQRVANIVIICVPNEYAWADERNAFKTDSNGKHVSGHLHFFTAETFMKLLSESGLQVIEFLDWKYVGWAYFIVIGLSKRKP